MAYIEQFRLGPSSLTLQRINNYSGGSATIKLIDVASLALILLIPLNMENSLS